MNKKKFLNLTFEILKFGTIGIINATIDFSIYLSLTRNFDFWKKNYLLSNIIAFIIANIFSFFANKKITFRDNQKTSATKYIKFLSITLASLIITEICLLVFVQYLHILDIYGKILGIILGAVWNFIMYKKTVFKNIIKIK